MQTYQILEKEFADWIGTKCAVAVNTGTAALHLSLVALGVGPGDEVLVPEFTFISTAFAVSYTGAKPVFYDSIRGGWQPDIAELQGKITNRTKAIIVAHIYGVPVDMFKVTDIASYYDIPVVEDACEAHGAIFEDYKVGSLGTVGCFSFQDTKIISSGEGGMIVTDDEDLKRKLDLLKSTANDGTYYHSELAFNYRMPNSVALDVVASMTNIDAKLARREEIWQIYDTYLEHVGWPWVEGQVAWVYPIKVEIPFGRPFFKNMSSQPMYGGSKNTAVRGTVLPIDPLMSDEAAHLMGQKVAKYIEKAMGYDE